MTPKEKAKEIYCNYTDTLNIRDLQTTANPFAKKCALVAINQILEFMRMDDEYTETASNANSKWVSYWLEVAREIEEL
jgi:hypothetical protein